jgi:SAM-dependent methyltransferase
MSGHSIDADAFNAFEASGWEQAADGYHRFFGPITSRVVEPLLDAAGVGPATRVLDVATGPGYVAARAAERGATVVGVDVSGEMLALAGRLHSGIEFRRGDAEQLPFESATFDAVVANFVVLHVGRPERAATEFARVLAPGGKVALSTWNLPERARLFGVFLDAVEHAHATPPPDIPTGPPFFRFSDDAEFTRLLSDAGLRDVEVQTLDFSHRLGGPNELWDGLLGGTVRTRALVLGQTSETQARIRAAYDGFVRPWIKGDGLELPVSVKLASGCG